jgi:hypothetical protein
MRIEEKVGEREREFTTYARWRKIESRRKLAISVPWRK